MIGADRSFQADTRKEISSHVGDTTKIMNKALVLCFLLFSGMQGSANDQNLNSKRIGGQLNGVSKEIKIRLGDKNKLDQFLKAACARNGLEFDEKYTLRKLSAKDTDIYYVEGGAWIWKILRIIHLNERVDNQGCLHLVKKTGVLRLRRGDLAEIAERRVLVIPTMYYQRLKIEGDSLAGIRGEYKKWSKAHFGRDVEAKLNVERNAEGEVIVTFDKECRVVTKFLVSQVAKSNVSLPSTQAWVDIVPAENIEEYYRPRDAKPKKQATKNG